MRNLIMRMSFSFLLSLPVILILHFVLKGVLRTAPLMMQISCQEPSRTVVITLQQPKVGVAAFFLFRKTHPRDPH